MAGQLKWHKKRQNPNQLRAVSKNCALSMQHFTLVKMIEDAILGMTVFNWCDNIMKWWCYDDEIMIIWWCCCLWRGVHRWSPSTNSSPLFGSRQVLISPCFIYITLFSSQNSVSAKIRQWYKKSVPASPPEAGEHPPKHLSLLVWEWLDNWGWGFCWRWRWLVRSIRLILSRMEIEIYIAELQRYFISILQVPFCFALWEGRLSHK